MPGFHEIQPHHYARGGKDSVAQNLDCSCQFHFLLEVYKQAEGPEIVPEIQKGVVPSEGGSNGSARAKVLDPLAYARGYIRRSSAIG